MDSTYHISGMTCGGCASKVQAALSKVSGVTTAVVDKPTDQAQIVSSNAIDINTLRKALKDLDAKYDIQATGTGTVSTDEPQYSWLSTYRPILLIFAFLMGITLIVEWQLGEFETMRWMRHFMAGFFLVFSFFKFLDLKGFANSYRMYDIVAARWSMWGYIYPFVELGLGVGFLTGYQLLSTNIVAFVVMSVSIIGVLRSVLNKKKIQCACLGAVFDLPMSTVTIIEDALMIVMSGWMILHYLN